MTDHPYRHRDECRETTLDLYTDHDGGRYRWMLDGYCVAVIEDGVLSLCEGAMHAGLAIGNRIVEDEDR